MAYYLTVIGWIGPCKKYHNILKIVVWVVRHVNLTFALPFVPDLHVQRGSVDRKFAYWSVIARKRSTLAKVYFTAFVFLYVQEFSNERSELEGLFNHR